MKRPSNVKTAISETPNLFGLASAFALSAAFLTPLPLMVGLAVEAGYLLFAPDSKWYNRVLERRYQAEVDKRREELKNRVFPFLSPIERGRYVRLENSRHAMQPAEDERPYLRGVMRKLDYLLEKYLLFAAKRLEFQNYLLHVRQQGIEETDAPPQFEIKGKKDRQASRVSEPPPSGDMDELDAWAKGIVKEVQAFYQQETDRLNKQSMEEENPHNQALQEKRIEIMTRRSLYVQMIADIFDNLSNQMRLMEDALGLIGDEIRARSPEQVIAEIDTVVNQSDALTEALRDMSPFDEMPVAKGGEELYNLPR